MTNTRRPTSHWLALLALVVGLCWVSNATATTALKLDLQSLVANSHEIVMGNVTEVRSFEKDGRIYTETTVRVDESWKGDATGAVTIRHPGGRVGDTVTRVFGLPGFEPDERVVVFLNRAVSASDDETSSGHYTVTGLRQGKFHISLGPDEATEFVVPRLGDMQLLEPRDGELFENGDESSDDGEAPVRKLKDFDASKMKQANPAPIHEKVLALDDFRKRVREAIDMQTSEGENP